MSKRIEQVNELIKKELGIIIPKEIEFPDNIFVTISKIQTTRDLKNATVFVTILPENKSGSGLEILNKNHLLLQRLLAERMVTKFTPKLKFIIDEKEEEAFEIERILDEISSEK